MPKKVLVLLVLVCLSACTSDENILSMCNPISPSMVEVLNNGLKKSEDMLDEKTAMSVKSKSFDNIYFIAAEVTGPNIHPDDKIGVWASNSLIPGEGMVWSINWTASNFSVWPSGEKSQARITMSDDGARDSASCSELLAK